MSVDPATLRDLEVLGGSLRGSTLLALVDRTHTRAGREQLRRHLTTLAPSADAILQLQRAHRTLAEDPAVYRALVDRCDTDGVERYLNSNWQLPDARSPLTNLANRVRRPVWFREYLRDVGSGRARVAALHGAAHALERLSGVDAPPLRELAGGIQSALETPHVRQLWPLFERHSTRALSKFDQLARGHAKGSLGAIVDAVAAIEAMWSLGVASSEHGWSYPSPGSQLSIAGLYHPFLGGDAVPNDLRLDGSVRVCFVTGPNMAGKSTFLKAIAIAALLAHVGCGVPARSMEFPIVGTIFSSIEISDSLSAGESFYLAEVRRIKTLALALSGGRSAIAVLDEPFRGTNVQDAVEATLAVLTRLAGHRSALVFVASHLGEVVPAISGDSRIRLLHFAADLADDRPQFDYRLRNGMSAQRLGMTLLRQEEVLHLLEDSGSSSDQAALTDAGDSGGRRPARMVSGE